MECSGRREGSYSKDGVADILRKKGIDLTDTWSSPRKMQHQVQDPQLRRWLASSCFEEVHRAQRG